MLPIRVYLLGVPRIDRDGETLHLSLRKAFALFVYLAVTGQPHSRDSLAALFWPENDQANGRAMLRRILSRLKQELGEEVLTIDREQVSVNPAAGVWLDVKAFQEGLAEAQRHQQEHLPGRLCEQCQAALAEAAGLYAGDFMAGFSLRDSPGFDEWQFFEAESLRQKLAEALQELVQGHVREGEYERGIDRARRWLSLDSLNEAAQRQLMQLYAWSGQQAAALRQYQECVRLLWEELGIEPEEETRALYAAIKARQLTPPEAAGEIQASPLVEEVALKARYIREERLAIGGHGEIYRGRDLATGQHALAQEIRFCTAPNGDRIAYAAVGQGPPLVKAANWLSHLEFDWDSPVWRHWLTELSKRYTLVRYDERGCGLSDWDVEDFSFEAWVRDLESVVDAAGLEQFTLLGLSQGGPIAIAYAVRHPEKVSRLILYGSYARGFLNRNLTERQLEESEMLIKLIELGWGQENPAFRQVFTTLFIPEGTPEQLRWFNELQRISTSPENAVKIVRGFGTIDVRDLAAKVSAPTLVLHSKGDARIPFEEGRLLAALIPDARFVPLNSNNHVLLENEPAWEQFLDEVIRFTGIK